MAEQANYYRIVVKPNSAFRVFFLSLIALIYMAGIFYWPYFIPVWIKILLIALFTIPLLIYPFGASELKQQRVLLVNEKGQVTLKSPSGSEVNGRLCRFSYFFPGIIHLRLLNSISDQAQWVTVFFDQIDEVSIRRLRRIILALKQQQ